MLLYKHSLSCLIACYTGTYGASCNETCGHCFQEESCLHTNGTCIKGCEPGYIGNLCNACKYIFVTYKADVIYYNKEIVFCF